MRVRLRAKAPGPAVVLAVVGQVLGGGLLVLGGLRGSWVLGIFGVGLMLFSFGLGVLAAWVWPKGHVVLSGKELRVVQGGKTRLLAPRRAAWEGWRVGKVAIHMLVVWDREGNWLAISHQKLGGRLVPGVEGLGSLGEAETGQELSKLAPGAVPAEEGAFVPSPADPRFLVAKSLDELLGLAEALAAL